MDQLRQQSPDAFARLVAEHQGMVLGVGQSLGLSGADLDDATAEAFAAVYCALPTFEGRSELSTWVYRISFRAVLRVRNHYRSRLSPDLPTDPANPKQEAPEDAVMRTEINALIWRTVAELEPRQAMVVELHYRREWPVERIAETLECPAGTVKTLLSRARDRLRTLLSRQGAVL